MKLSTVPRRIVAGIRRSFGLEGSWRGVFTGEGEFGGQYVLGRTEDGWQRNLTVPYNDSTRVPMVYACGQAYARVVSTCVVKFKRVQASGLHEVIENHWVSRLLRNPNSYETFCQYIFNTVSELSFKGSSLSLIIRDDRFVPIALHRVNHGGWSIHVDPETREIFYGISHSTNDLVPRDLPDFLVPARDVIHFRQHCPRHPLMGESPITAAALAVGINVALSSSQMAFFSQMRRPSGIMSTDQLLNKDQIKQLREAFDEQAERFKQGGIPILAGGLKFQPMSITSQDAQLIDAQKLTNEDIARVFAVPLPIVGTLDSATLTNSEVLVQFWLSTGLGSLLENLEQTLWSSFGLSASEYVSFDTAALLRTDQEKRVAALTKGIQGGLFSPNEARATEGLPAVDSGDEVFMQQQMIPVSLLSDMAEASIAGKVSAMGGGVAADPEDPEEPEEPEDPATKYDEVIASVFKDFNVAENLYG